MSAFAPVPSLIKPAKPQADRSIFENYPDPQTFTHENILNILWQHDDQRITVSERDENGNWINPEAGILLDKQQKAEGSIDSLIDSSPNPLFHTVRSEKLDLPTYKTFIELLDNYDAIVNNLEELDRRELTEINAFLDAILETKCMHICFDYITIKLGVPYTWSDFKKKLFAMWFEIHNLVVDEVTPPSEVANQREQAKEHRNAQNTPETHEEHAINTPENSDSQVSPRPTNRAINADDDEALSTDINYYRGKTLVNYCSGFEHVFMGEILRVKSTDKKKEIGNVLGYHNWIKFYIDERQQLVDYLGTKYAKNSISKIGAPFVCIRFRWDQDGEVYVKDRGSFFVGISPEFAIAVSTVCYFETYNLTSAAKCGWEDRSSSSIKFKTRRTVGGYIYDYYLCREKKYLVSCFQEIIGPTPETKLLLEEEKLKNKKDKSTKHKVRKNSSLTTPDASPTPSSPVESSDTKDPSDSPSIGARVVKPKHKPAAIDPEWQAFYVIELKRLKLEDPTLSDKAAFRLCKEAWKSQGKIVPSSGAEDKAEAKRQRRAAKRTVDVSQDTTDLIREDMQELNLNE